MCATIQNEFLLFPIIIETSTIHGTLVVIANEVKQSSKTKMHFLNRLDCRVGFAFSQ